MTRPIAHVTVGALAAAVAVGLPPDRAAWSVLLTAVRHGAPTPRLDDVAALIAATGLWCLAVWVLVALLAGRLAALPGAAGRAGALLVRVCVPRVLRGLVVGGVTGGLLLGPAVAAAATPVAPVWPTTPPASAAATPGPAWPTGTPPADATPRPATPPATPTSPATPPPPTPPATPGPAAVPAAAGGTSVVVAPGDSLWSISSAALARSGVTPTPGRVAAAWPSWYAVNRAAIGDDPGLLHPGTSLTAPTPTDGSTR